LQLNSLTTPCTHAAATWVGPAARAYAARTCSKNTCTAMAAFAKGLLKLPARALHCCGARQQLLEACNGALCAVPLLLCACTTMPCCADNTATAGADALLAAHLQVDGLVNHPSSGPHQHQHACRHKCVHAIAARRLRGWTGGDCHINEAAALQLLQRDWAWREAQAAAAACCSCLASACLRSITDRPGLCCRAQTRRSTRSGCSMWRVKHDICKLLSVCSTMQYCSCYCCIRQLPPSMLVVCFLPPTLKMPLPNASTQLLSSVNTTLYSSAATLWRHSTLPALQSLQASTHNVCATRQ
jgi:hypothetical protein